MLRGEWLLRLRKLIWDRRTYAKRQRRYPQNWLRRPARRRRRLHARELETLETRTLLSGVQIVKDVNPATDSADPREFVQLGGMTYFNANDGIHGSELWKTDGTAAGTVLVKDINPGSAQSSPYNLTILGDEIYFSANDGVHGAELWKTDGTEAGTTLVSDIAPGIAGSFANYLTVLGDEIYFRANDGTNGTELWKTDGTTTELVADIYSGSQNSSPTNFTVFEDHIYFRADDNTHGSELWRTDGTTTELVKDIRTGSSSGIPGPFTVFNGALYFQAIDATSGYELWKTDGTEAGTELVEDINPGSSSSSPGQLTVLGNELYFQANDGTHGYELWKTNGSTTELVKDINPGNENASLSSLTVFQNELYFRASDTAHGSELWKSDGTEQGTVLVKDINPGSENSFPSLLTVVGDSLYFNAVDATYGAELWKSDGTEQGTVLAKDVLPGSASSNPLYLFVANDTLFFQANDGAHGVELWTSDGTEEGTTLLKDINTIKSDSSPTQFVQLGSELFFTATDSIHGLELWKTDGTKAGTVLVKDIRPGIYGSNPTHLTVFNGKLYFTANSDRELWTSDGTESGTVLVKDVNSTGIISSDAQGFAVLNGALYFGVQSWSDGAELWKTDGTSSGTTRVKGLYSDDPYNAVAPGSLTVVGGAIYFLATNNAYNGYDLWKSDGTPGGTTKLIDEYTSPLSGISNLTALNGKLYFSAYYSYFDGVFYDSYGEELWTLNGSTPQMVKDIYTGGGSASPQNLTLFNSQLYFTASDETHGKELWRTNGTESGTARVTDINPSGHAQPGGLTAIGSRLYFYAYDGTNGYELWSTNGSTVTFMKDINTGSGSSVPSGFTGFDGEVFFYAYDSSNGGELWKTDGTTNGTRLVADIEPGAGNSDPVELTPLGQQLIFSAETAESGRELWSYYINAPAVLTPDATEVVINEGETATNTGTYVDETPGSVTLEASLGTIVNNGDGTWNWSLATDDNLSGPVTVTITATDDIGNESETTFTLTVNNIAPALSIAGASSINEAGTYTLNLTSSDIPGDTITSWFINWGDGSDPDNDNAPGEIIAGNPSSVTHAYADGTRWLTIQATATDEDGTYRAESTGVNAVASLDSSFGDGGEVVQGFAGTLDDYPTRLVQQSDGKLIEVGYGSSSGDAHGLIVRWNADGTLDSTFGNNGQVILEFSGNFYSALVLDDGKILVGGQNSLWRFNADGSRDDSFGIDGRLAMSTSVDQLFVDSNGRILAGSVYDMYRLSQDGTLDLTFGNSGWLNLRDQTSDEFNDGLSNLELDSNDRLIAVGYRSTYIDDVLFRDVLVKRYTADGQLDTDFATNGELVYNHGSPENADFRDQATQVLVDGTSILIGGITEDYQDNIRQSTSMLFLRLSDDGTLDTSFGESGALIFNRPGSNYDRVDAMTLDSTGRILASYSSVLMRFSSTGVFDDTLGPVYLSHSLDQLTVASGDAVLARVRPLNGDEGYNLGVLRLNSDITRDTDFGDNGLVQVNFDGQIGSQQRWAFRLDNGKLLTFGDRSGGNNGMVIQRYLPDGTLDTSFGTDGEVFEADFVPANVIEDGNGNFYVQYSSQIRRYTASGVVDTTFDGDGTLYANVSNIRSISVDASGRLVVLGREYRSADVNLVESNDVEIKVYLPDGTLDTSFGTNGTFHYDHGSTETLRVDEYMYGMSLDDQGRIVTGGYSLESGSSDYTGLLLRLNADGTFDTTFGQDSTGIIEFDGDYPVALAIDSQQRILTSFDNYQLERRLTDGSLDTTFGTDGNLYSLSYPSQIQFDSAGRILVTDSYQVQRLLPDGTPDGAFGPDGKLTVSDYRILSILPEGEHVLLTGYRNSTSESPDQMWLGQYATGGLSVQVNNVSPSTPVVTGPTTANEGDTIALSVSSSDPAGENDPLTYSWTIYFNGTQVTQKSGTDISFVAADSGSYRAYIQVQDDDGGARGLNYYITVAGVAPTASFNAPASVQEGTEFTVSLTDPDDVSAPDVAAGYEYAFDFGSGYGNWSSSNSAAFFPEDGGNLTVKGKIRDKDNAEREYTAVVNVIDSPPSVAADNATVVINEGETATNTGTYSDPESSPVTLAASLGTIVNNGDGTWNWSLATDDNLSGPVTVTITATDDFGNETDTTFSLTVNNVAPELTIAGAAMIDEGGTYTLNLTSSDIPNDTITSWFINWGDGSDPDNDNAPGEIVAGNPSSVTHVYADGTRWLTIQATATDEDGTYRAESTGVNATASLDPSFGVDGEVLQGFTGPLTDSPNQIVQQPDGKLIEIGYSQSNSLNHSIMARWNSDGTLDTTFGNDGQVIFEFTRGFTSALVLSDGKILVGSYQALWRFNADGSLDDSFGIDGKLAMPSGVNQLFLDSTGRILAGDNSQMSRLLADGSLDLTFGTAGVLDLADHTNDGITDYVSHMALDGSDRLVVAGSRQTGGWPAATYDIFARRYDVNGQLDTSFGTDGLFLFNHSSVDNPNFQDNARRLVIDGETILIGGTVADYRDDTTYSRSILFLRLTESGALDNSFGDEGVVLFNRPSITYDNLYTFQLDSTGRILASESNLLMRFSASGVWDEAYGVVNVGDSVNQFVVTDADTLFVSAQPSRADESSNFGVLHLNADGSRDTSFGTNGVVQVNFNGSISSNKQSAFRLDDGKLLTFGQISGGGDPGMILQRYLPDGTLDTAFGTNGQIFIADIYPSQVVEDGNEQFYVQTSNQIRRYTADGTLDTTFGSNGILAPNVGNISKFTVDGNGRLIISGVRGQSAGPGLMSSSDIEIRAFSSAGVLDTNFGANGVFQFDNGTTDSVRVDDYVRGLAIDNQGRILIAAYSQQEIDFLSYVNTGLLMRLNADGTFDTTFGGGGTGIIENEGHVYYGVIIDSQQRVVCLLNNSTIERRLADGTLDASFGDAGSVDTIYAQWFTLDDTGRIVLFTYDQVQRLLPDGEFDESFGSEGTLELANELPIVNLIAESEHVLLVGYQSYTQTSENMMWMGQYITGGLSVQVKNVNPSTPVVTGPTTANEGDTIALSASSSDVAGENDPLTYAWTIYRNSAQVAQGTGADISFVATDSGSYQVYVNVQDGDGGSSYQYHYISVAGVAPTATFNAPATGTEGTEFTVSLTDPDDVSAPDAVAGYEYAFDFGSGYGNWSSSNSAAFTPTDGGDLTVKGKIRDKDNAEREYTAVVTVNNVDPTVSADTDPVTVNEGVTAANTGTYADAGGGTVTLAASIGTVVNNGNGTWSWSTDTSNISEASTTVTITATDANSAETTTTFALNVTNLPPGLTLTNQVNSLPENTDTSDSPVIVADINIVDFARGTNVLSLSGTDAGYFTISNGQLVLRADAVLDYESTPTLHVTVNVNDDSVGESPDASVDFTLSLTPVNEDPTAIALSANSVDENQATPTDIGTFSTTDADSGETFTYTLVSGTGDTDNGLFTISGSTLQATSSFDAESQGPFSIRVRSTDSGGLSTESIFTITVNDLNEDPTAIALSANSVDENQATPTDVGTFSTTDPDTGESFTYTLVSGSGDTDNGLFSISGSTLQATSLFDAEAQGPFSIRVRSTDSGGLFTESTFTITVNDLNETPTAIALSANSVDENQATPTDVGTFSTTDPDTGESFTYTLVTGTGDTDNGLFNISGSTLQATSSFDAEAQGPFSIRVRSTDSGGLFTEETFVITVNDLNEPPTAVVLTPTSASLAEDADTTSAITLASIRVTDDALGTDTLTLTGPDAALFSIVGTDLQLKAGTSLDFETKDTYSVTVNADDATLGAAGSTEASASFTLTITNLNDNAPVVSSGQSFNVLEDATPGEGVGFVVATDADGSSLSPWLIVSGNDDGVFSINASTGEIIVTDNSNLDAEGTASYSLGVRVFDGERFSATETVTINVTNVNDNQPVVTPGQVFSVSEDAANGTSVDFVTATDADGDSLFPWVIVSGNDDGVFNINASTGEITVANNSNLDAEGTASYSLGVQVFDGQQYAAMETVQVDVTNVNEAPEIGNVGSGLTTTERAQPRGIATEATLTDVDTPVFDGGVLTVSIISGGEATDLLTVRSIGQLQVSGSNVTFGGVLVGTLVPGNGETAMTLTFNENAEREIIETILHHVTFQTTSLNPSTATRLIDMEISDGAGATSSPVSIQVHVTPINDAPVIEGFDTSLSYREGHAERVLDQNAVVTDVDSPDFDGGTLTVQLIANGEADDILAIRNIGTAAGQIGVSGSDVTFGGLVIGTFSGGNGSPLVVTFNSTADATAVQALLRKVTFANTSQNPSPLDRTVQVTLADGDGNSSVPVSKIIEVDSVNDAPVISDLPVPVDYTENDPPVLLSPSGSIVDIDSTNFSDGQLTVSFAKKEQSRDVLSILPQGTGPGEIGLDGNNVLYEGTVIGTFTGGTFRQSLVVTFNAQASPEAAEALLRRVAFSHASENMNDNARIIEFQLTDGDGGTSLPVEVTVNGIPEADPPILGDFGPDTIYREGQHPSLIDSDMTVESIDSADFDGGTLTVALTANATSDDQFGIRESNRITLDGNDVLCDGMVIGTVTGGAGSTPLIVNLNSNATAIRVQTLLRRITFENTSENPSDLPRTVQVTLSDGGGATSNPVTKSIQVIPENDAPVISNFGSVVNYSPSVGQAILAPNILLSDVDQSSFPGGKIVVDLLSGYQSRDNLFIVSEGTGDGQIGVSGNSITYEGTIIGTFNGGFLYEPLEINLNAEATTTAVQSLLRRLAFRHLSDNLRTSTRTVELTLEDGQGGISAPVTKSIEIAEQG